MLTGLRDFRDNFAAEIWGELGLGGQAALFSITELPVSVLVLGVLASLTLIRDNARALSVNLALIALGLALGGVGSAAFLAGWIGPVLWMTLLGAGLYLAYTPFNGMMFDRLVAASGSVGNAGFLIYVADTAGYAGSVLLLLLRNMPGFHLPWTRFLLDTAMISGAAGVVLMAWAAWLFRRRIA